MGKTWEIHPSIALKKLVSFASEVMKRNQEIYQLFVHRGKIQSWEKYLQNSTDRFNKTLRVLPICHKEKTPQSSPIRRNKILQNSSISCRKKSCENRQWVVGKNPKFHQLIALKYWEICQLVMEKNCEIVRLVAEKKN